MDNNHKNDKKLFKVIKKAVTFGLLMVILSVAFLWKPDKSAQGIVSQSIINGGQPINLPFPRLSLWAPDTYKQPHEDIARYNSVIFSTDQLSDVKDIKAKNPDLIALASINSCEVGYNANNFADPINDELKTIPSQWFLTQVGTTLSSNIDNTTTLIPVNAVTVSSGSNTYDLFVAGDAALIDGEIVNIKSVDVTNNILTVTRGYIRPASAHNKDTRIAALITYWPNSWVLNMSTMSPQGVADAKFGPEIWADYNARQGEALISDPIWDGILLDRADPDESWIIQEHGSKTRTIDPDQSNTLLTDYSAFDAAWDAGLQRFMGNLHSALGNDRIIISNWGLADYSSLNGDNFEIFPRTNQSKDEWDQTMFGMGSIRGSYFEWMKNGIQPAYSSIETYDDDSEPGVGDNTLYDNPCVKPGFVPNYQKMRFGLTSALLNDGFFNYSMNTRGQAALCLMWFDEYDNVGKNPGYLGMPVGGAHPINVQNSNPNLLQGGEMDSKTDIKKWSFWPDMVNNIATINPDSSLGNFVTGASANVHIEQTSGDKTGIQLSYEGLSIIPDTTYILSFSAKANINRPIETVIQLDGDPWTNWIAPTQENLTTSWQNFSISGTSIGGSAANKPPTKGDELTFLLGQASGDVWIDNVKLQINPVSVWQRDFTNGISLVNPTGTVQHVQLNNVYQKIKGIQAPAINDGSLVSSVTLQPRDGIILLRTGVEFVSGSSYIPYNLSPINNSALKQGITTVTLKWNLPRGINSKDLKTYHLQVALDQAFTRMVLDNTLSSTSKVLKGLLPNTSYYWRVQALLKNGAIGNWTSEAGPQEFHSIETKPPSQGAPSNKSKQIKPTITFAWSKPSGIPGSGYNYVIQYGTDINFGPGTYTQLDGLLKTSTKQAVPQNVPLQKIYWRVKVVSNKGVDYSGFQKQPRYFLRCSNKYCK